MRHYNLEVMAHLLSGFESCREWNEYDDALDAPVRLSYAPITVVGEAYEEFEKFCFDHWCLSRSVGTNGSVEIVMQEIDFARFHDRHGNSPCGVNFMEGREEKVWIAGYGEDAFFEKGLVRQVGGFVSALRSLAASDFKWSEELSYVAELASGSDEWKSVVG